MQLLLTFRIEIINKYLRKAKDNAVGNFPSVYLHWEI